MTFGEEGKDPARVHKLEDVKAILDVFQAHGHNEVRRLMHRPNYDLKYNLSVLKI
jgi:hypothetical protein